MQEEERKLDLRDYQVFVLGVRDSQEDEPRFVLTPENVDEEMTRRGLGNTPYLNLRLIQKFSEADNGDFGGDATYQQLTMFQNDSPVHFNQLQKAIETKKYTEESDWIDNEGTAFPLIKLNGIFRNSCVETRRVKPAYMVFKRGDEYELQTTDRKIGGEWDSYPSVIEVISKFFGGNEATVPKIDAAMVREEQRRYVAAFNCEEIDALAAKEGIGKEGFADWIAEIAPARIKTVLNRTRIAEEQGITEESVKTEVEKKNAEVQPPTAPPEPTVTQGAATGQPPTPPTQPTEKQAEVV